MKLMFVMMMTCFVDVKIGWEELQQEQSKKQQKSMRHVGLKRYPVPSRVVVRTWKLTRSADT